MQEENIDMWVLITREYNEDPVVKTFCLQHGLMQEEELF